jgi:hypothetical protein
VGSLALRPGDSLTIPRMALSVGFIRFVSFANATQATGALTLAPVGLLAIIRNRSFLDIVRQVLCEGVKLQPKVIGVAVG